VLTRGASTATTAGLANPLVATLELAGSITASILALVAPVLAVGLLAGLLLVFGRKLFRRTLTARPPTGSEATLHRADEASAFPDSISS
jgi:hypothetical protein